MSVRLAATLVALVCLPACGGDGAEPATTASDSGDAWFEEVSAASGIVFDHDTGQKDRYLFPEIVCGGVGLFDKDGDGDLDAYLVQSGGALLPRAEREGNRLFANRGDGTFEDVSAGSGAEDRGYGMGVASGDHDDDGDVDLYVTNLEQNALLSNDGTGRFTDVTDVAGAGETLWSASAGFFDYDIDGDLDLWVVNYIYWTEANERACYSQPYGETYCGPRAYDSPAPDTLLRNNGDGGFTNVSEEAGLLASFGNGLGIAISDFDGDGLPDVFVANDATEDQVWINQGDGRFEDRGVYMGVAADQDGQVKAGMGVGVADYDDDHDEDLLVVNMHDEPESFFRNDRTHFVDRTAAVGLRTVSRPFTRFGVGFHDLDHDGFLDLYVCNGNILHAWEYSKADAFAEPNLLFRGDENGRFSEVVPRGGTVPTLVDASRGAAFGDVDGDGDVDVLVVNKDGPTYLLRNRVGGRGHWVGFRVLTGSGRDAIGAEVRLTVGDRTVQRHVRSAYSYCAANDLRVHFGLGAATKVVGITVRWPDGSMESFGEREADRYWELVAGAGTPVER